MGADTEEPVRLTGRLTLAEVPAVYNRYLEWRDQGPPEIIDLADLEASDSSAVALLLEWLSWARSAGRSIRFDNPPEALRTLAGLSQVDGILGWSEQ